MPKRPFITPELREAAELVRAGFTIREAAKQTGSVSVSSLTQYLKSLQSEGGPCTCSELAVTMEHPDTCYVCGGDVQSDS